MRTQNTWLIGAGTSLVLTLVACSGSSASDFGSGDPANGAFGNNANGAGGNLGGGGAGAGAAKPTGDLAACATSTAGADPKPITLVFAYDRSGSMADNGKWGAAKAAMKGFFNSGGAQGMNASLTFFPNNNNLCSTSSYASPQVPVMALPSAVFGLALDTTGPGGNTPTEAALTGAINYAKQLQATTAKDATVAVVMVTDGLPQGCSDDGNVGPASNAATAVAATIPTYVVGVGDQLANLNQIAQAGGTKQAFVVSVGDPTKTQQDLSKAINDIRASALSCDYKIPAPPNGETFDRSKVNVQYTPAGAAATPLGYNQGCAGGAGWQYDDAANPTRILACDATCNQIKASIGKVDIVFGCATRSGSVN